MILEVLITVESRENRRKKNHQFEYQPTIFYNKITNLFVATVKLLLISIKKKTCERIHTLIHT